MEFGKSGEKWQKIRCEIAKTGINELIVSFTTEFGKVRQFGGMKRKG